MRFHCLQHVSFESPGSIAAWVQERGHPLHFTHVYQGDPFPAVDEFDALIIMGGPMSVHYEKEFPWLRKEKDLIAAALRQGKKVLGICLGAQLIAEASGAAVYSNPLKEIGFFPVSWTQAARDWIGREDGGMTLPAASLVFHWHGETFGLPEGAVRLAGTVACVNQAYLLGGNVLALQFHLEAEAEIIREMIAHEGHELAPAETSGDARAIYIQRASAILGAAAGFWGRLALCRKFRQGGA